MTMVRASLVMDDTGPPKIGQHMESMTCLKYTDTVLFQFTKLDELQSANGSFKNDPFAVIENNVCQPRTLHALDTPTTAATKREMFGKGINIPMSIGW